MRMLSDPPYDRIREVGWVYFAMHSFLIKSKKYLASHSYVTAVTSLQLQDINFGPVCH